MYSQTPQVGGAEAPKRSLEPVLRDVVVALLRLSSEEKDRPDSYDNEDCHSALQELADYTNNPAGKPERTIQDVVGEMFLVYQRKTHLQAAERQAQIAQLQRENASLQREAQRAQAEFDQAQEDLDLLRAEVRSAQQRTELKHGEDRPGQVSLAVGLKAEEMHGSLPGSDEIAPSGPSHHPFPSGNPHDREPRPSLISEAALSRRMEAAQLSNPARQEARARSRAHFSSATSDLVVVDDYQAPPSGRSWEDRAPRYGAAPLSTPSHPRFNIKGGDYPHARGGVDDSRRSLTRELGASRSPRRHVDHTPSPLPRGRSRAYRYSDPSDSGSSESDGQQSDHSRGLRTRQLESLAKDIERFDPNSPDANIEDYFREVERCLVDLPDATSREKLKLVWKTTARSVHVFVETLPPNTRDRYATLRKALREEYSLYTDEASATLGAFAILQKKHEPPREYFRRLRTAYFQGRNAPGLEEDHAFKSLFLHNLHESLRYDVTMHCRTRGLTMQEIKKYAQLAWETRMRPNRGREVDARVLGIQALEDADLALEGSEVPRARMDVRGRPLKQRPPTQQGGRRNQGGGSQPQPQNQTRASRPDTSQQRGRGRFEQNTKQGNQRGKWRNGTPSPSREKGMKPEMEDLIRKCVSEAVKQLDIPRRPPDSQKGAGTGPPSA